MTKREQLIAWLKEAYNMEHKLIPILEKQILATEQYPDIKEHLQRHLSETKQHANSVENCLRELGSDGSELVSNLQHFMGMLEGQIASLAEDKLIKFVAADLAVEQFEMAHYRSIQRLAEDLGETHISHTCKEIFFQEEKMAKWLTENLDEILDVYLDTFTGNDS